MLLLYMQQIHVPERKLSVYSVRELEFYVLYEKSKQFTSFAITYLICFTFFLRVLLVCQILLF